MSKTIVKLRVYKGREVLLKADGKTPANENELITLTYNDLQWKKHLSNLAKMGVCKIEIDSVYQVDKGVETKVDASQELKKEIEAVLKPATTTQTPEQKRISELEAKLDALVNGKTANDVNVVKPIIVADAEAEFKTKVDLLIANGFERVEDNFTNADKTYSVERVYQITLEDLTKELTQVVVAKETPIENLAELQAKYKEKFQKELPKPFKNNVAWIKTQLEA